MTHGPVTKSDERNSVTSKKIVNDVMSANCDVIVFFFPIYGQFAAIWKPDSGRMVYKTYIYINNFIDLFILQNLKAELENL